ncbi:hypothetical protein [Burkholderia stabilis]|uniref:hypothetical protein n=1 Tax=Burkholderia stabilis TaxID=95485 RepID=UPI003B985A3A
MTLKLTRSDACALATAAAHAVPQFRLRNASPHVLLVDRKTRLPVRKLELRSQDGRVLGPEDTVVLPPPD